MQPEDLFQMMFDSLFQTLWTVFKETWWFWLLLFIIWLLVNIFPKIEERILRNIKFAGIEAMKNDRQMLYDLRKLKPWEFEDYIASLYSKLGYTTERVGQSHDGGIDVIAEKDGIKQYIQCKKYITRKVRATDVRDFYGAISSRLANGNGIFITTNLFTTEARKFADDNMIEAIDGNALIRLVKTIDNKKINNENDKNETEKCPNCGGNLIRRFGKNGPFYGCSNFHKLKCKFTRDC